jgi:transcriptional regulator of met regulon
MTNNKQQTVVKLYTEEQVRKMLEVCIDSDLYEHILTFEDILKTQTPIELPSDEELRKEFDVDEFDPYDLAYLGGAIWMRDKIQGGNK